MPENRKTAPGDAGAVSQKCDMRELREAKGLSIFRLAWNIGVWPVRLILWEHGVGCPKCATVAKMADSMGVSVKELYLAILNT